MFKDGLLSGRTVALASGGAPAVGSVIAALQARTETMPAELSQEQATAWARARSPLTALVVDARGTFGAGGLENLSSTMNAAWLTVGAVATEAMIATPPAAPDNGVDGPPERKIVLVAPAAGDHAKALCAALENLARTLSTEWARYAITTTLIALGPATGDEELATLVAYLLSAAGGYFSGCRLNLGGGTPRD